MVGPVIRLTFDLEEPPSLNAMIEMAKTRNGPWSKYAEEKDRYEQIATVHMRNQHKRPNPPWETWAITRLHFRLWNHRDPLELAAGAKWIADALVKAGYVADDSHRHLLEIATPTQEIARKDRGVTIEISQIEVATVTGEG